MASFQDAAKRTWDVAVNVAAIQKVRTRMDGFDLQALGDDGLKGLASLLSDPVKLAAVVWTLCEGQHQIGEDEFYQGFFGDTMDAAGDAFTQAFFDFGRKPMRVLGQKVMAKAKALETALMDRATAKLDAFDPNAEAATLIGSSGEPPASSASTPAREPSAN